MGHNNKYNLTDKQKRFCDEYLLSMNATQSAKKAGYSDKTAAKIGSENLQKPYIKEYLEKRRNDVEELLGINMLIILNNHKEIAERCMQKVPVMEYDHESKSMKHKIDEHTGLGLFEFNHIGANNALKEISRHLDYYPESKSKIESTNVNKNIDINNLFGNLVKVEDNKD